MRHQQSNLPFYARSGYRICSGSFGLVLSGLGFYILFLADLSMLIRFVTAAVMLLVGLNSFISACKAREPWLSRFGPFP